MVIETRNRAGGEFDPAKPIPKRQVVVWVKWSSVEQADMADWLLSGNGERHVRNGELWYSLALTKWKSAPVHLRGYWKGVKQHASQNRH
jgi:hypothetical protein